MTESAIKTFASKAAAHCIREFGTAWKFVGEDIRGAFIDAAILRLHNQRDAASMHSDDVQPLRNAVAAALDRLGYSV